MIQSSGNVDVQAILGLGIALVLLSLGPDLTLSYLLFCIKDQNQKPVYLLCRFRFSCCIVLMLIGCLSKHWILKESNGCLRCLSLCFCY